MYFLVALVSALTSGFLAYFLRHKRVLHLEFLAITYGAATLMWFIDCIKGAIEDGEFLSFEIPLDIYISLWTITGGLLFWGIIVLVLYYKGKKEEAK